jgi:uncharacterized protein involved in type VI secretion and phage assembly
LINGLIVGIVIDNKDPDKMNRVKVKFPVESGEPLHSSWCRVMSPMGGLQRGLVILPDVGTEVVLSYAYRSMSAYVVGAVYNGDADKPEPYKNDDSENNKRVFWSRNDHMVIFDDTSGAEQVGFAAKAGTRLDVTSGPIWHTFDSAQKIVTTKSEKHIIIEAKETISLKCKDFKLETDLTVAIEGKQTAVFQSGVSTKVESSSTQTYKASKVDINGGAPGSVKPPKALPSHKHPPTK